MHDQMKNSEEQPGQRMEQDKLEPTVHSMQVENLAEQNRLEVNTLTLQLQLQPIGTSSESHSFHISLPNKYQVQMTSTPSLTQQQRCSTTDKQQIPVATFGIVQRKLNFDETQENSMLVQPAPENFQGSPTVLPQLSSAQNTPLVHGTHATHAVLQASRQTSLLTPTDEQLAGINFSQDIMSLNDYNLCQLPSKKRDLDAFSSAQAPSRQQDKRMCSPSRSTASSVAANRPPRSPHHIPNVDHSAPLQFASSGDRFTGDGGRRHYESSSRFSRRELRQPSHFKNQSATSGGNFFASCFLPSQSNPQQAGSRGVASLSWRRTGSDLETARGPADTRMVRSIGNRGRSVARWRPARKHPSGMEHSSSFAPVGSPPPVSALVGSVHEPGVTPVVALPGGRNIFQMDASTANPGNGGQGTGNVVQRALASCPKAPLEP